MDERFQPHSETPDTGPASSVPAADNGQTNGPFQPRSISDRTHASFDDVANERGGAYVPLPIIEGAVGFTHFDTASSEDNSVVVLLPKENMHGLPLQTLVRIKSLGDDHALERSFLGVVVGGPFAEPDGLRADSPIIVATTVQGRIFLPRYHGRAHIQILGEEVGDQLVPPRYRPRPNSPVFPLDDDETRRVLRVAGTVRLGTVVGQEKIEVSIPTDKKSVLPRHLAIIGTTGSGKSTTTSGIIHQFQNAGVATVLFDVEGEYTEIDLPTDHVGMREALKRRGLPTEGTNNLCLYHLVGREVSREAPGGTRRPFCLRFSELSPYAVMEILELVEAQQDRFIKAYEVTRQVLQQLAIFPRDPREEQLMARIDELEMGYPRMTLAHLLDIAGAIRLAVAKRRDEITFSTPAFQQAHEKVLERVTIAAGNTSHEFSWLGLIGKLGRLRRLGIFDNPRTKPIRYPDLIQPGTVSVIDLSDTDSPQINNLVIAGVLRGIQRVQEKAVQRAHQAKQHPTPVEVVIEEAHEFLSRERIAQMRTLFQQVARIAKRGRKRWLGLVFVTQLPQHLPDEVLGLVNNFIIHKIGDSNVVDRLRKVIPGLDKAQWSMVPGLAPGQAIVSLTSLTRPLLVAVDPTPCKLRLVE